MTYDNYQTEMITRLAGTENEYYTLKATNLVTGDVFLHNAKRKSYLVKIIKTRYSV